MHQMLIEKSQVCPLKRHPLFVKSQVYLQKVQNIMPISFNIKWENAVSIGLIKQNNFLYYLGMSEEISEEMATYPIFRVNR